MGRLIAKLGNHYLEWSTVVDAPVTFGMTLEEFREHYREQYGAASMAELEQRLARVEGSTDSVGLFTSDILTLTEVLFFTKFVFRSPAALISMESQPTFA